MVLEGIISGQLYDQATPYLMTNEMKKGFKSASLPMHRGWLHGMNSAFPDPYLSQGGTWCLAHIQDYFDLGYVSFSDGAMCGAPFPGECYLHIALAGNEFDVLESGGYEAYCNASDLKEVVHLDQPT